MNIWLFKALTAALPLASSRRTEAELDQLRVMYPASYTGAEKLYQQQRRAGLPFTLAEIKTFVKEQPIAQRFAPPSTR